jgi:3-oxoacyl-[acyl-carrier protein] reductase
MHEATIPTTVKNQELVLKRREQIVLAAIKLFAEKGFHKTNLRELAEEAGISHGNIYDYVGTKQDIFFLIHEFINSIAIEKINQITENIDDPLEKLRRMVRAEFELMHEWSDAILLIYQQTHILDKALLKALLTRERKRVSKFEETIEQCIKKGQLRDCNLRVAANLVKSMTEMWVTKRWDLRGHVDRVEMEKIIIDVILNGLLMQKDSAINVSKTEELQGKSAFVINAGTLLGKAIAFSLASKGAKLSIQILDRLTEDREYPIPQPEIWDNSRIYSTKEYGPMTNDLFERIVTESGPFDIIIHDLGIGNQDTHFESGKAIRTLQAIQMHLELAQKLAKPIQEVMRRISSGRLIYLVPWAWHKCIDPIRYQTTKAGIVELTRSMSKLMASGFTTVNCVIPGFIGAIRPMHVEKEKSSEVIPNIPMGYIGETSDVLEIVHFLISNKSKYLTGQVFTVSGGMD